MGCHQTMGNVMGERKATRGVLHVGKIALMGAADATHAGATFVKRHESKVASVTRGTVWVVGKAIELGGAAGTSAGFGAAAAAKRQANQSTGNRFGRSAATVVKYAGGAMGWIGVGVGKIGGLIEHAAPVAGHIASGAVSGGAGATSGALDSVAITEHDIAVLRAELERYGRILCERADTRLAEIKAAQKTRRKTDLLDTLVVGGVTLSDIARSPDHVPPLVEKAFDLQYPDLAQTETFSQAVQHASPDQLLGLVNGVKGKLFELSLVDHLNTPGQLPDGWHAVLAHGATQPGWDLQVLDAHDHIADLIQAKATESVEYIRQALERYPSIDITTTSETYSKMAAMGLAQHVHNGGVALTTLNGDMANAVATASDHFHGISFVPSSISLAVIALSVLMDRRLTWELAGYQFGSRAAKAGAAVGVANAAMVVTQTWWIGLLAGVGTRLLAVHGEAKRARYQVLKDSVGTLREMFLRPAPQY